MGKPPDRIGRRLALVLFSVSTVITGGFCLLAVLKIRSLPGAQSEVMAVIRNGTILYCIQLNLVYFLTQKHGTASKILLPIVGFATAAAYRLVGETAFVAVLLVELSVLCVVNAVSFTRNRFANRAS